MKKIVQQVRMAFAMGMLMALTNCAGDGPSAGEVMTNKLTAHPWKLSVATVDGTDKTFLYDGLTITFTSSGYTATNGLPIWPASGTWSFKDSNAQTMIRNDGLEIEITEASETELKLTFTWFKTTYVSGRSESITGFHVFTFTP